MSSDKVKFEVSVDFKIDSWMYKFKAQAGGPHWRWELGSRQSVCVCVCARARVYLTLNLLFNLAVLGLSSIM